MRRYAQSATPCLSVTYQFLLQVAQTFCDLGISLFHRALLLCWGYLTLLGVRRCDPLSYTFFGVADLSTGLHILAVRHDFHHLWTLSHCPNSRHFFLQPGAICFAGFRWLFWLRPLPFPHVGELCRPLRVGCPHYLSEASGIKGRRSRGRLTERAVAHG